MARKGGKGLIGRAGHPGGRGSKRKKQNSSQKVEKDFYTKGLALVTAGKRGKFAPGW